MTFMEVPDMAIMTRRAALKSATGAFSMLVPAFLLVSRRTVSAQGSALRFEIYRDKRSGFRWRLKAGNGQVIATSGQGYKAKADCRNAIDVIKRGASSASIDDQV